MWAYFLLSVLIKNICVRLCMCVALWYKQFPVQLESKGSFTPFLGYLNYLSLWQTQSRIFMGKLLSYRSENFSG